jgi:FkbM family methyltransferase
MRSLIRRFGRGAIGEEAFAALRGVYWPLKLRLTDYEPETRFLPDLVPRGGVCIDAGGNFGQFASYLARVVGPEGMVHSFEPLAYNRRVFTNVMRRMRLDNVTLHPFAVGARRGTTHIAVMHRNTGEAHVDETAGEVVEVVTLDDWGISLSRLDFLKIDVEGFELEVLRGAERLLSRFRPAVLCEITGISLPRYGVRPEETFDFLTSRGYSAFVIQEHRLVACSAWRTSSINYFFTADRRI